MNRFPHREAFTVLMRHPEALQVARRLARDARPVGRLFALCMLKALEARWPYGHRSRPEDHEIETLATRLTQLPGRVTSFASDVVDEPTVAHMVVRILHRRLWQNLSYNDRDLRER